MVHTCHKVRGQIPQETGINIHRPMKPPNLIYARVVQDRYTSGITILFAIIGSFCLCECAIVIAHVPLSNALYP